MITFSEKYSRKGQHHRTNHRDYTRVYVATVPTADQPATEVDVLLATGCPKIFDVYGPQDLGAKCVDVSVEEDEGTNAVWTVTAEYTTDYGKEDQQNDNPLLRPAIWRYESVRGTRTEDQDKQGNAYETPAGEPYKTPPANIYSTSRYTITRNEATFASDTADYYAATVNDADWYGKAAGTVLLEGISADEQYEGEYHFFQVVYTIHVDRNGWSPVSVGSKGHKYLSGGNTLTSNTLIWVALDGTKSSSPVYQSFYPYDERDFSALQL